MISHPVGFGVCNAPINIYIANRPQLDDYPYLNKLHGLAKGEIAHIAKNTRNHWRKVFNVYAKFLFDWYVRQGRKGLPDTWQEYRERELFQAHSQEALLFSHPDFESDHNTFHLVAGKTYAAHLNLPPLIWLDPYFAINETYRLIVTPYADYRQLSNERIARLIELMKNLK
ncbi:MAG: hypothetical protein ABW044_11760 [Cellvibrio sp.]